jgi:DNA-binding FadR family transcriptional regulator
MRAFLARLLDEHREIVDAISAKDAGAAHAAMHRHLKGSQERYERLADARR